MKNKDFKDLLTSIDQAKKIHAGKLKTTRVFKFHPITLLSKLAKTK